MREAVAQFRRVLSSTKKTTNTTAPNSSLQRSGVRLEPDSIEKPLPLLLAVSGGRDSVVLLDVFAQLAEELSLKLAVAHVDHGLRQESEHDAGVVESLASQYRLPYFLHRARKPNAQTNLEAWGRQLRYAFFAELLLEQGFCAVCTAHHRSDQAETILMRLLSGRLLTDAHGIAGIDRSYRIFRPLLSLTRQELQAYASARSLESTEDSSNYNLEFTRNKIRHQLLPSLAAEYNPSLVETLAQTAERLTEDETALEAFVEDLFQRVGEDSTRLFLRNLSGGVRWRYLRLLAVSQVGAIGRQLGYDSWCIASRAVADPNGAARTFDLGFGIRAEIDRASVTFEFDPIVGGSPRAGG